MKPTTTKATIGRIVWLWAGDDTGCEVHDTKQAFPGQVYFVNEDDSIDVSFVDHDGEANCAHCVKLGDYEESDCHGPVGSEGFYATWMPYQKQQHDKAAREADWAAVKKEEGVSHSGTRVRDILGRDLGSAE